MAVEYLTELAQQWIAEQGAEAGQHLADAIRELRAVGDEKGARLLSRIAQRVDLLDGELPPMANGRHHVIRRARADRFDPSA